MTQLSVEGWQFIPKQTVDKNTKHSRKGRVAVIGFIRANERIIT
jgi:hypothetical protein